MKKNKQRLFEVMGKVDGTFKPNILNEVVPEDDPWSFLSQKVDVDVDGIKEKFYPQAEYVEVYQQKINVKWHIVPEVRDYGIKSMFIVIDGIFGVIYYEIVHPDENIPDEEAQLEVEKYQWNFKEQIEPMVFGDGVYPTEVELDFRTMTCTVIFG